MEERAGPYSADLQPRQEYIFDLMSDSFSESFPV